MLWNSTNVKINGISRIWKLVLKKHKKLLEDLIPDWKPVNLYVKSVKPIRQRMLLQLIHIWHLKLLSRAQNRIKLCIGEWEVKVQYQDLHYSSKIRWVEEPFMDLRVDNLLLARRVLLLALLGLTISMPILIKQV